MNWEHFKTFLWLRWRLSLNQGRRSGIVNAVLVALAAILVVLGSLALSVIVYFVAVYQMRAASPAVLMLVWDGFVVAFLFFSMIGLITELQRSEALSLDKFLHLPVSPTGAFVINYVSSLFSLVLFLIVPGMVSLSVALVVTRGPAALLLLPLVAAFVLMVTAALYQFRGWLAALMVNKRRRRTIIVTLTGLLILLAQAPQLFNVMRPGMRRHAPIVVGAPGASAEEIQKRVAEEERQRWESIQQVAIIVNLCVPPGWLPLGAWAVLDGKPGWALACAAGMGLLGVGSLWRAYRTTIRMYTGHDTGSRKASAAPAAAPVAAAVALQPARPTMLEQHVPWVTEQTAAIALAHFRSLLRAPEAKLALMSSLIVMALFGMMTLTRGGEMPERFRPLLPFGCMGMVLLTTVQFIGNQFGFDRDGFRVFVLSPAPRGDILLGKNLGFAPVALGCSLVLTLVIQAITPLRPDWFLAALVQQVAMYLIFCLLANLLSILAPVRIAAGSMKPVKMNLVTSLLYLVFTFSFPVFLAPMLLPFGAELALEWLGWWAAGACLVLSLLEAAAVLLVYRFLLPVQGDLLQAREQRILEVVTTKAE